MADVLGAVDRLRLAAQHEAGSHLAHVVLGQGLQQTGEVAGLLGGPAPRHAQMLQELRQRFEPGRVGLVVHAVEAGLCGVGELAGRRDVGRDHELLDQHVAGEPLRLR